MRLLTHDGADDLCVTHDLGDVPPYAILSHTWGADEEEVTYHELQHESSKKKVGYRKIRFCGQQAARDNLSHFWVDTCCIDKTNHNELSEAITSMYRWYQNAHICYVYLADVSIVSEPNVQDAYNSPGRRPWKLAFRKSRWFTRGWTLQELLAPRQVVFFSKEWQRLGSKSSLEQLLHEITSIPIGALRGQPLCQFSVSERMRWTDGRSTKKKEDQAYCLLGIFNVYMPLLYGEQENAFRRLRDEINRVPKVTQSLRVVEGAVFEAYGQVHLTCHPDTRVELLDSIRNWARDANGKNIFWLNGMAGTGKSTISMTVARWLTDHESHGKVALGGSFFFQRGAGDQSSARLLFPTLIRQLARKVPGLELYVSEAIDDDPDICTKSLGAQFRQLVKQPLERLRTTSDFPNIVVIVDALDECDSESDIRTMLQLWSELYCTSHIRVRLLLTSRPVLPIRMEFNRMPADVYQVLVLHELSPATIEHDISVYLQYRFHQIREEYNLRGRQRTSLDHDWPGQTAIRTLTNTAVPLFIVAATMCGFIQDSKFDPRRRLEQILQPQSSRQHKPIEQMYYTVLTQMVATVVGTSDEVQIYEEFMLIVGTIVALFDPLTVNALASLLNIGADLIEDRLESLHSVLRVPPNADEPVRMLHLSFGEYMCSEALNDSRFYINRPERHRILFHQCLKLLSGPYGLHQNICGLDHSGQLRRGISTELISQHLSLAVRYACWHWVHHLQASSFHISDGDEVHTFLQRHFLHWLEALSLLDRLADSIELIKILHSQISTEMSTGVAAFLEDARRFILANRLLGEIAPLQLHSSAIVFAPRTSIVRNVCGHMPPWIRQAPKTPLTWSLELQKLEGHNGGVVAVAFSPDGSMLASASFDMTVRLWQVSTGREVQKLEGHTNLVLAVTFSPDGSMLASASGDKTVRPWQVSTGREVQKLEGHTGWVWAVAFSPDGSMLASASNDETVRLWQMSTGREVQKLEGHTGGASAVSFSPDGSTLASASRDKTVRLWQVSTGREVQELEGHTGWVLAVAFSPDGSMLASASRDKTVRLWQVSTGREVQKLEGHIIGVLAVTFSPDGSMLASASHDRTVRLWQVSTGREVQKLEGHTEDVWAVTFSPDGSMLASASGDRTVRLWQVSTGQEVQKVEGHTDLVLVVTFSPDGSMLASASGDKTVRLWQVITGREVQKLEGHTGWVFAATFSPDGSMLASASGDKTVRLWQVSTGRQMQKLEGHTKSVEAVTFSPDGSTLASASYDKTVRLWQVSTGREVQKLEGQADWVPAVTFSPDGSMLASASDDKAVRLWQVSTGREVQKLEGHTGWVWAVAFSPDGSMLASASFDKTVRLWQVSTGREVQKFEGHTDSVLAVTFSLDGSMLASASHDRTVRLWQASTGREVQGLQTISMVTELVFSIDNST